MSGKHRRTLSLLDQPTPNAQARRVLAGAQLSPIEVKQADASLGVNAGNASNDVCIEENAVNTSAAAMPDYRVDTAAKKEENKHSQPASTQTSPVDTSTQTTSQHRPAKRFLKYLALCLLALLCIWAPALLFIKLSPPSYKSSWTIVIPGTTTGSSINLDSLGEANTSVDSQYGGSAIDPKVNYKAIILSTTVLDKAAAMSDMSPKQFGKPKIKLIDQTAMLMVTIGASSAEQAQQKAENLYTAFTQEVDSLRSTERKIKQHDSLQQLNEYQAAVDQTQKALQDYRADSEIVSIEQYKSLLESVSQLAQTKRESETNLAAMTARFSALEKSLGMDPGTAASIIKLRQDLMVQSQLRAYSEAHAGMVEEEAVLGKRHPKVVHARSRTQLAYNALLQRADEVLGTPSESILDHFMPTEASADSTLYPQLVQLHGEKLALESEVDALNDKVPEMNTRMFIYADEAAQLEELERDHEIANTILVSATARLDLGKSDIYASYPMTQLLSSADLPEKPGRLKTAFALLGAVAGTLFIVLAVIIMWNRKRWLQLIQKRG